jgi:hypothetical protein
LKRLLEYSLVQVGLVGVFVGPLVCWIAIRFRPLTDFDRVLKWVFFGVIIFFFVSTFSKKFEANWTIFLAVPIIVMVASSNYWSLKWVKVLLILSFCLIFPARLLLIIPPVKSMPRLNEFHGWQKWAENVQKMCGKDRKLLANNYQLASKLSFYLDENIHALNFHSRKNQFDYWTVDPLYSLQEVCYLTDKQEFAGLEIQSPEGKQLRFVTGFSLDNLNRMKANTR